MLRRSRGLSALELLLALAILAVLAFLLLGGGPRGERGLPPETVNRAAYDGEALAKFGQIRQAAIEHLETHGRLFTWVTARDLGLGPTPNWSYSLRRLSALEIAVYAHGRGRIAGRRWRLQIRSDGSATTVLEAP